MRQAKLRVYTHPVPNGALRPVSSTVAGLVVRCLKAEGVSKLFLIHGGPVMPFVEAAALAGLELVQARHESGAVFMADGFQRVAGGLAVCVTTAGPGATNAATGIACAFADGVPMLIISAQPGSSALARNPVQDSSCFGADTVELYRPITKKSVLLTEPARVADVVRYLIRLALSGRPGPVHLAIPADMFRRKVRAEVLAPAHYRPVSGPVDLAAVARAADLLLGCKQLVILAGNGVRSARAQAELAALAELLGAPVATTPKAKGILAEHSQRPQSLRVFGFGGSELADEVIFDRRTDCLLAIGTSLGELESHAWDARLRQKRIIQIDIEPARIANAYPVELAVVGDARATLSALHQLLASKPRRTPWRPLRLVTKRAASARAPLARERPHPSGSVSTPQVIAALNRHLTTESTLFVDIGGCMTFALRSLIVRNPNGFHINFGFASMGHAVAAVIGAQLARPHAPSICLCGDGAMLMNLGEIHSAVEANAPCTWVVLNNSGHSSVRAGVRRQFGVRGRRAAMLRLTQYRYTVDFARLAEGMGARAIRVEKPAQLEGALAQAIGARWPTLIDVRVDRDEEPAFEARFALLDKFFNRKE